MREQYAGNINPNQKWQKQTRNFDFLRGSVSICFKTYSALADMFEGQNKIYLVHLN